MQPQPQPQLQPQHQHDPRTVSDAQRLRERVITLKWLRMVGVPLPMSTASRPQQSQGAMSIDPIHAAPDVHELFHDGFLLCR